MSKQTYRVCFFFRRKFRLSEAEAPADVKAIFDEYAVNRVMGVEELLRFLVEVQEEENATVEDAQAILDKLHDLKHLSLFHKRGLLHHHGFFKYLFGDLNPPLNPKLGVHHDMKAPLSHYFIYTSHNSYLTGNQLSSVCSDAPIKDALLKGVRVIELDIWPNSTKDNIDVLHGWTLTTRVQFIKCLRCIKEHAFTKSEYPVVITLEDHLTPDLQAKAAEMITETFGETLFSHGPECLSEFPSPEFLKKRIIISTKPPKEYLQDRDEDVDDDEDDDEDSNYRRLIAIHAGKGKGGMQNWFTVDPNKARRLSLSEQELEKAVTTHSDDIVRFTQKNLLRVYPKGTRFDSSNYNPMLGWMHGAQMVAFNMQGYGRSLWLMQGMFRANGGCGYVKKPNVLLNTGDDLFHPNAILPVKTTLKVTLYMGEGWYHDFRHTHFDKCSPPDFYARVGIAGVRGDARVKRTETIEDNWIPTWDEKFEFPLTVPELSLLWIEVYEHNTSELDEFAGQTCLPISELRKGVRAVPLHSRRGVQYKSVKLLMRFHFI